MGIGAKYNGHDIKLVDGEWYFCDTDLLVSETWKESGCGYCKLPRTDEGHDGCLGTLPGIMNACCGHGNIEEAYIQYWDKNIISGSDAVYRILQLMSKGES